MTRLEICPAFSTKIQPGRQHHHLVPNIEYYWAFSRRVFALDISYFVPEPPEKPVLDAMRDLPADVLYLVCEELANRQDFGTLFNCAVSSKSLVTPALLWMYRYDLKHFSMKDTH